MSKPPVFTNVNFRSVYRYTESWTCAICGAARSKMRLCDVCDSEWRALGDLGPNKDINSDNVARIEAFARFVLSRKIAFLLNQYR